MKHSSPCRIDSTALVGQEGILFVGLCSHLAVFCLFSAVVGLQC